MNYLFEREKRQDFLEAVKISIATKKDINKGIDLETAFRCGYLDVARAPLRGINTALQNKNPKSSSVKIRDEFIRNYAADKVNELLNNDLNYDEWHRSMCDNIASFYKENGYDRFTVGKAQKWINMAMKYACIYDYEHQQQLSKYMEVFHVPIDRYIANPIAIELHIAPPCYKGGNLELFDADKKNYVWSNIENYDEYIECQKEIRQKCGFSSPLRWEFEKWLEAKRSKSAK